MAIALLNAGRSAEAAVGFRQVIRLKASNEATAAAYFNLGIAFKDLARHQDSAVAYLSALRLRPAFPQAHFNLGRSFQLMADDPGPAGYLRHHAARRELLLRAAHHFRRSGGPDASTPGDSYRSLEEVLHQLGDTEAARRAYVEFLRHAPSEGDRKSVV